MIYICFCYRRPANVFCQALPRRLVGSLVWFAIIRIRIFSFSDFLDVHLYIYFYTNIFFFPFLLFHFYACVHTCSSSLFDRGETILRALFNYPFLFCRVIACNGWSVEKRRYLRRVPVFGRIRTRRNKGKSRWMEVVSFGCQKDDGSLLVFQY